MTGAVLIAIYLLALAWFLGLDILGKVPATLYAVVLAGLGALAGVSLVGGWQLTATAGAVGPVGPAGQGSPVLAQLAIAVGAAAAVGGTLAIGRSLTGLAGKNPSKASRPS